MDNPTISIIIPVYNASLYLAECIGSVLSQSFHCFEVLLINDGSKDGSGEICDAFSQRDGRIKVFHQENRGVSVARNFGLDNAQGNWIMFIDADDILMSDALKNLYQSTLSDSVDVVLGGSNVLVKGKQYPYHIYSPSKSERVLENMNHPALWGYLIRTSVIKDYDIRFVPGLAYSEDVVFLSTLAIKCRNIAHISDIVYLYRKTETAVSATKDGVMSSGHQFHAAYLIDQLIAQERNIDKKLFLIKKKKKLVRAGCYDFASLSFSFKNYPQYERQYLSYFEGKLNLFIETFKARFLVIRRRILNVNDDPLQGREGIISKIKKILGKQKRNVK